MNNHIHLTGEAFDLILGPTEAKETLMRMTRYLFPALGILALAVASAAMLLTGFHLALPSFTEFIATASPLTLPSLLVAGAVAAVAWMDPAPLRSFWSRLTARTDEPVPRAL